MLPMQLQVSKPPISSETLHFDDNEDWESLPQAGEMFAPLHLNHDALEPDRAPIPRIFAMPSVSRRYHRDIYMQGNP